MPWAMSFDERMIRLEPNRHIPSSQPRCMEKVGSGTCIEMPWNVPTAQWTWPLLLFSESSRGNPWKHQGCTMLAMPSLRLPFPMLVVSGQTICNSQTSCFSCTRSCLIRYHDFLQDLYKHHFLDQYIEADVRWFYKFWSNFADQDCSHHFTWQDHHCIDCGTATPWQGGSARWDQVPFWSRICQAWTCQHLGLFSAVFASVSL